MTQVHVHESALKRGPSVAEVVRLRTTGVEETVIDDEPRGT